MHITWMRKKIYNQKTNLIFDMTKTNRVFLRLSDEEKSHLTNAAKESGLSLSEYIRVRLLEKEEEDSSGYKREMIMHGLMAYYTLGEISKKQLTGEELDRARKRAEAVLNKWKI